MVCECGSFEHLLLPDVWVDCSLLFTRMWFDGCFLSSKVWLWLFLVDQSGTFDWLCLVYQTVRLACFSSSVPDGAGQDAQQQEPDVGGHQDRHPDELQDGWSGVGRPHSCEYTVLSTTA